MKVLVCGGRDYEDGDRIYDVLFQLHDRVGITHVIHGDSIGADKLAHRAALDLGIQPVACPANWNWWSVKAGPIRNGRMLELSPDLVIAFPGGRGTANCVNQALEAGIDVDDNR